MTESKDREFWFEYMSDTKEYGQLSTRPPYVRDSSFELIHVIEKSFADKLQAELDRFKTLYESEAKKKDEYAELLRECEDFFFRFDKAFDGTWEEVNKIYNKLLKVKK